MIQRQNKPLNRSGTAGGYGRLRLTGAATPSPATPLPTSASYHAARTLAPGGTVLLVEPFAEDAVGDNLLMVSRLYYTASTTICCAYAISEGCTMVVGAQAGHAQFLKPPALPPMMPPGLSCELTAAG